MIATGPGFALFRDGKQISKAHSTRAAATIEAFERGAIVISHADFWAKEVLFAESLDLSDGYEIREVP
jgi:hypothetical protein